MAVGLAMAYGCCEVPLQAIEFGLGEAHSQWCRRTKEGRFLVRSSYTPQALMDATLQWISGHLVPHHTDTCWGRGRGPVYIIRSAFVGSLRRLPVGSAEGTWRA
jgi:hypothetical protein